MTFFYKKLYIHILNICILSTLILSPIPFYRFNVYAAETDQKVEPDCRDDKNKDGTPGIYKAGCKFNEDLGKSKVKSHYPEGIAGIIEQFVSAAFAMVGVGLFYTPKPQMLASCAVKTATGAAVTFPIVQASALAYLIGEVSANKEFKDAAKVAVDMNFQAKKNENTKDLEAKNKAMEENNKQLKSYDALLSIYEKQVNGLDKKIKMATLAEAGLLTATGFEISDMIKLSTMCETTKNSALTIYLAGQTELTTACLAAVNTNLTSCAASVVGEACAASCGATLTPLGAYNALLMEQYTLTESMSASELARKEKDAEMSLGGIVEYVVMIPVNIVSGLFTKVKGLFVTETATDSTVAATNDTTKATNTTARQAAITTITTAASLCPAVAATCAPAMASIEESKQQPILCCGTQTASLDTLDLAGSPMDSNMNVNDTGGPSAMAYTTPTYKDLKNNKYLKPVLQNFIRKIAYDKWYKKNDDVNLEIAQIAKIELEVNKLFENDLLLSSPELKYELEKFQDLMKNETNFETILAKMKSELLITSAHAGGAWSELLNIGIKAVVLYMSLWSWLEDNAFPRPKTRAWTWGTFAAINGLVLSFDMKSKGEAEKRVEIVREEKKQFAMSHSLESEYELAETEKAKNEKVTSAYSTSATGSSGAGSAQIGGQGSVDLLCASPSGNTFIPADCSKSKNTSINLRPSAKIDNIASNDPTGALVTGLNAVGVGSTLAARGALNGGDSKQLSAALKDINKVKPAIQKLNKTLTTKLDTDRQNFLEKNGVKGSPLTLGSALAKSRAAFSGDPSKSSISMASMNSGGAKLKESLKDLETKFGAKVGASNFKVPTFNMPSFNSNSGGVSYSNPSYDSPNIDETPSESGNTLAEFKTNAGEIHSGDNVNIFKLISNRYLLSYPVFFDEKKAVEQKK